MNENFEVTSTSINASISILSFVRVVMLLLPHLVKSERLESSPLRNKWWYFHKRISLLHYLVLAPLFEVFIIWGSVVFGSDTIQPVVVEVLLAWLSIVILSIILLLIACCTRNAYRMMVYSTQLMELACTVMFFSDRCKDTRVSSEISVVVALVVCNVVEVFTVPDFFFNYFPRNEDVPKLSEQELNNFNKTIANFSDTNDTQSQVIFQRSLNVSVESLFSTIESAEPNKMAISDMRDFIALVQRNVGDIKYAREMSSATTPRTQSSRSSQADATNIYLSTDENRSNGMRRKTASNEKPEC